jgi:hypothetical protein
MDLGTLVITAPLVWIAAVIAISVLYRRKAGKPIFPRAPKNAVFSEAWASGRSLKSALTRIGGARNCLLVYVADGMLTIVPVFPFNLMFLSEIFGLEMTVPTKVISLEQVDGLLGKRLRLSIEGSIQGHIELSLRDPNGFQAAMAAKNNTGANTLCTAGIGERKRGWRFVFFRVFAIFWGAVVLVVMTGELKSDFQFRRDGIVATATMVGHTGQAGSKGDNGILQYSVQGRPYRIVSIQGSGIYRIGDTTQVRYLPNDPASAREDGHLTFDLLFVLAGICVLTLGLTLGRLTGFITRKMNA